MKIEADICQNLNRALSLEWLETNGRSGFASGTVAGANTRRYHALLLTAPQPGTNRYVLVNHVEEWLSFDDGAWSLSTNLYPGAVHPDGYIHCSGFSSLPWPTWTFAHNNARVRREILCIRGRDLVIIRWKLMGSKSDSVALRVRPMLTGRDYHAIHHENEQLSTQAINSHERVAWQSYHNL